MAARNLGDSSPDDQRQKSSNKSRGKQSISNYVNHLLTQYSRTNPTTTTIDSNQTQIHIDFDGQTFPRYERLSAFRRYQSEQQQQRRQSSTSDIEENDQRQKTTKPTDSSGDLDESMAELNLDPNPIFEERESEEQVYQQKVYLRQLQPPTPQPVEIQVQEILISPPKPKSPINVLVGKSQPRTPSPIIIKSAPPPPPLQQSSEPIIYNKYIPPPKQPPRQIIVHRYPELPPKPRPIVVEQWLPYKPAPKRIIKQSLPAEARRTPPAPHNIIVSYSKPRALIEVELVRLPVVKIDPQTYQQMSEAGQEQLIQNPIFRHEQEYLHGNRPTQTLERTNLLDWRI